MGNWLKRLFAPKQPYRLELFMNEAFVWQFRIRHTNGNILATSESYSSHAAAWSTAEAMSGHTGWPIEEVA